jgi:hypothetical protein
MHGKLMFNMLDRAGVLGLKPGMSPFALERPTAPPPSLPQHILDAKQKLKEQIKFRLLQNLLRRL